MSSLDLARIVCGLPEATLLVSPGAEILAANPEAGRLLEQTPVELVGRNLISFVTDPEGATQYLHKCLRSSQGIPGGLQLQISHGRSIQCKAVGAVAQLKAGEASLAWIRLVPRESANNQIVVYNERLQALSREIKAFQQSEERWRTAFENSAIGIAMADLQGRFLVANSAYQAMLGYTEEEVRTLSIMDITHEGDREFNWKLLKELLEGKRQRFQIEKRNLRKDGTVIWVRVNASLVPEKSSLPTYLLGVVEDITERKHSEEALRRSERYLTEAQRLTKTGSWAWTTRGGRRIEGWHYWSEEMFRIFEFDPRQGPPTIEMWRQRIHAEDREQVKERIQKARRDKGEYVNDYRILFPDGRLKYIHVIGNPVFNDAGEITEYAGTSMDLTEQKRTEEALRRSEAYLAEGQRLTHTGSWAYNPATKKALYWSEEMFRIHGLDPQQVPPTSEAFLEHVHPEDRESVHEAMCNAVQEKTEYEVEHRMILPNGTIRHVHALGHPVLNRSGDLVEIVGSAVDVTERKRAEEALRRSEAYLAEGQRLTHTGSWALNVATHEALHSSAEHTRLSGLDPEKGLPSFQEFFQRVHPEDQEHVLKTFQTLLQTGGDLDMHYRIAVPGGPVRYMHGIGHPVPNQSGIRGEYVGIAMDVTERKRSDQERERLRQLEADLAHMNRVSMMGELTASLAHELSQPIAAATTDAYTCLDWLTRNQPDLEEAREAATRMTKAGTRAAEIINGLRSFYKKGAPAQRELVDVGEIIREMTVLLRNEAARWSVSVHLELADGVTKAMTDRVQLQQVFMNLMLNAIEAMRETGGELQIRSQVDQHGLLLISVSDTGVGLPGENADRIFDAFFTTKPQGTGMGLAITRSIIEAHGGRLWATGNPERGVTFQFTLPPAKAAHA